MRVVAQGPMTSTESAGEEGKHCKCGEDTDLLQGQTGTLDIVKGNTQAFTPVWPISER